MRIRSNLVLLAILVVVVLSMLAATGGRRGSTPPALAASEPAGAEATAAGVVTAAETALERPVEAPVALPAVAVDPAPGGPPSGRVGTYTAVWGDTVSNLAAEMEGGDDEANRGAVIHANPSLRRNPDLLFAGQTYTIPADGTRAPAPIPAPAPAQTRTPITSPAPSEAAAPVPARPPVAADIDHRQLRYTARAGDTVSMLAAVLLGENGKANRDLIVGANPSLQRNPDRVVDGRVYRIPVGEANPLSAAPQSQTPQAPRPAVQPDADHVIEAGSPRELRYTARAGDTVSTLALALLGSDTAATRAVIVGHNPSLVEDPDRVIAGQTYRIDAPASLAAPRE